MNEHKQDLKVCEIFNSISGEGLNAGIPATFIRFSGCNMNCDFCDTKYHNEVIFEGDAKHFLAKYGDMLKYKELIIFTGGEPAVQNWYALNDIIYWLKNNSLCKKIEIETNGLRFDLFYHELKKFHDRLVNFSVDFKMHKKGDPEYSLGAYLGYKELGKNDCIKVVVKNREEIDFAMKLAMKFYNTNVFVSPCYGCIDAAEIADYIVNKGYQKLRMQIQLHKYLWGDERGK